MPACDEAVSADPENGVWRRSRGVARALSDDIEGAIGDLRVYVAWEAKRQNQNDNASVENARTWIAALEARRNPFDAETLEALKKQ